MKRILLLGVALVFAGAMNAQVIFLGLSPSNVAGGYEMTYGKPGSDWGNPDFGLPANSVTGDLVAYGSDSTACTSATNGAALLGNIAVVYRADCSFSSKVLKAEAEGAIACVIINNVPGDPIAMAGGTDGLLCGIPAIMISQADGATLKAEMMNGPVNVFIGNKAGYFANDLGVKASQILRPKYSSIPSALATTGAEYQVDLRGYIFNHGNMDQTDIKLKAVIEFGGTELYNETSASANILSGDSALFTLPDFVPATWAEGYYSLKYSIISGITDEYVFDDALESDFVISPTDLSYANFDETTMKPSGLSGLRAASEESNFSSCITFRDANSSRLAPRSISFSATKGADAVDPSMVGEEVLVQVILYDDNFTDINDAGYSVPVASPILLWEKQYQYTTDAAGDFITVPFDNADIQPLLDNQRYIFCVNTFNDNMFFGHDGSRDYTLNIDYYLQPMFPIEVGSGSFDPRGFGPETVTGVTVGFMDAASVSLKQEKLAIKMNAYPSPASDILNVDFKSNEVNKVELVNMMGQTVVSQNVANNADTATMNVAGVENGVYIVKVHLANNMTHTMQVVVNH